MDRSDATQLGRPAIGVTAERVRAHREGEMRALPVHIAVVPAAQLGGGQIDQRVGTALRAGSGLVTVQAMTERVDGGLHQRAALGIELTAEDEDAPIRLLALEPAPLVGAVVIGEHPVGIDPEPRHLGDGAHAVEVERLRRAHQDVLQRRHLLHTDVIGELGDHGHVAQGGATGPGAVETGRQLAERARQPDAGRARLPGHGAVIAYPGRGAARPVRQCAVGAIEAVQATEELGLEAIGSPPEVDEILAQRLGREAVDGLADERIDCLGQTLSGIRYGERFHTEYYTKHLFATHGQCGAKTRLQPVLALTHRAAPALRLLEPAREVEDPVDRAKGVVQSNVTHRRHVLRDADDRQIRDDLAGKRVQVRRARDWNDVGRVEREQRGGIPRHRGHIGDDRNRRRATHHGHLADTRDRNRQ